MRPVMVSLAFLFVSSSALAFDLNDAYNLALARDPQYRMAVKEFEAGVENETIGRAAMLPKINASYYKAQNRSTQWGQAYPGGPNVANRWQYPSDYSGVFLNQPLINLEAIARWRQGVAQSEAASARFVFDGQSLLLRVLQAYLDTLNAKDQLGFARAELAVAREQKRVSRRLYEKGEGALTDALEAETAYRLAEVRLIDDEGALIQARQRLGALTGASGETIENIAPLSGRLSVNPPRPLGFNAWESLALDGNQELKALAHQVEAARQEYRKNEAGHYPTVNLTGAMTTQNSNSVTSINQTTNQNYVGIQISLPLFSGGETVGRSRQAHAAFEKSQAEKDFARNRILSELRKHYDLVSAAPKKIDALAKGLDSARQLVKANDLAVRKGERVMLDVLISERSVAQIERDLAQARYAYLIGRMTLHQLAGHLVVEDLQELALFFRSERRSSK